MSSRRRRNRKPRNSGGGRLKKWLAGGVVGLLLVGVLGLVFGYRAIREYLRSDDFRIMLGEKAGGMLGGEARFQPFVWEGWSLKTEAFDFSGEGSIGDLAVSDIDASVDIGAIWDGIYRIENVSLRKVELTGDFREREVEAPEIPEAEIVRDADTGKPGMFDRFIPTKVEITGIEVGEVSGTAMTDDGDWTFEHISAAVEPGAGQDVYELSLQGGEVETPLSLVKSLKLREAKARYSKDRFYLLSANVSALERASIALEGEFDLENKRWTVSGDLTGARCEELVSEDWRQRLMGAVSSDFRVRGEEDEDAIISGTLEITQGMLTALPVLDRIAAYTNAVRFRHLALSEATLDYRMQGDLLELTNIRLGSEGLVRVEGNLILEGEVIRQGNLRLGITPGTLAHLPGAETKVFRRGELGLLWSPVKISGTLDSPQEDLSDRLIAAAGERMFEIVPATGQWALKYSGEIVGEHTKDVLANSGVVLGLANEVLGNGNDLLDAARKSAEGVLEGGIETGTKAASDAARSVFDIFGRPIPDTD
ncbi:MAG: hypothetical protein ACSHYF_14645 [Verrucomicrobiaceae bacterium]